MEEQARNTYINTIANLTDNSRLRELFCKIPEMTEEVFNKTVLYGATKEYEAFIASDNGIPQNFFALLEESIKQNNVLKTYKMYQTQLDLICNFMNIERNYLITLLRKLNNENIPKEEKSAAYQELKEIIRKFTSQYKETKIKEFISQRKEIFEKTLIKKEEIKKYYLDPARFIDNVINNPDFKERIKKIIKEYTGLEEITDYQLRKVLEAIFEKNPDEKIADALDIVVKKNTYNKYAARLVRNFTSKLNNRLSDYDLQAKTMIVNYLNLSTKQKLEPVQNQNIQLMKRNIPKGLIPFLEETSVLMSKCDATAIISANELISFVIPGAPQNTISRIFNKDEPELRLKSLHKKLYTLYQEFNRIYITFLGEDIKNESKSVTSKVNVEPWLKVEKIKDLIAALDLNKVNALSNQELQILDKFLNQDGLLWAYLSGNIELDTIAKIINNFSSIYISIENERIIIDNLDEIISKANLYDFADPIAIGLYGTNVVSRIISYNQFSGVQVTKETIKKRLRKAVDLAVRGERQDKSSLPYNITCRKQNLTLRRYKNNDPLIMLSGVDTKTCFFISVNENDFFFYTIVDKNGCVFKVTDEKENMIARASCFRKNNILMINGIRFLNNKTTPENKEEMETFKNIIDLIEIMGKKIIEATTGDECPIDHVVCNMAGLLENPEFEQRFARVNASLFREPVDIYSEDWETFIHMYDNEEEQLLQEVPFNGGKSFTTDFGEHFPALIIASRPGKYLDYPRDISLSDQEETYKRPRVEPEEYLRMELTEKIILRLNRIKTLSCFLGTKEEIQKKKDDFIPITNIDEIKNVIIGEDWYIILYQNDTFDFVFANEKPETFIEARPYLQKLNKVAIQNKQKK